MRVAAASLVFFLGFALSAQAPAADDIIRVTTNLVQLDVVVTDNRGNLVTDLKIEDFEILQDGKPQQISNFSFVDMSAPLPPAGSRTAKSIQRANVRRSIAIVVDDLRSSWNDLMDVRTRLKKYVNQEILPGDLVSISLTSSGAFTQFTTNLEFLKSAIDRIKFNATVLQDFSPTGSLDRFSFAELRTVMDSMKDLPGRKSIMFIAPPPSAVFTEAVIQEVIGRANSAGVNIYTVIPSRLITPGVIVSAGSPFGGNDSMGAQRDAAANVSSIPMERLGSPLGGARDTPDPLAWPRLASGTGGFYEAEGGVLGKAFERILTDQGSYYLLGYRPSQDSFDRKSHKIEVKVRRPGLRVRTHTDFIADPPPQERTSLDILSRAVNSPFDATAIRTSVWPVFSTSGKDTSNIQSAVFVDGRDLQFEHLPDGTYRGAVEFILQTIDIDGLKSTETRKGLRLNLNPDGWAKISQTGVSYVIPHPSAGPGIYRVRVAVRDPLSGDLGSASQLIEVPDIKKKRLAVSGLLVRAPEQEQTPNPLSAPATRVFERGHSIEWMAEVYHPKAASNLYGSVRLYRDTKLAAELPYFPLTAQPLPGGNAFARGLVPLDPALDPGDYVMELLVTDEPPSPKIKSAVQRVNLEVIP